MHLEIAKLLRSGGLAGVTFRSVAESAGMHPANLQYRFGTKARLLECGVREVARRSLDDIDLVAAELPDAGLNDSAVAQLMRLTTTGRSDAARADALVLLELLLGRGEDAELHALTWPWVERLSSFWQKVAAAAGCDAIFGVFLADLHFGLLLHFSGSVNRVETDLVCAEIVDRSLMPFGPVRAPWFAHFFGQSLSQVPGAGDAEHPSEPARAILVAGVGILRTAGPRGLTYRALAEAAGVSVSAVTHYFATSRVLVYSVYRALHRALVDHTLAEVGASTEVDPAAALRIAAYGEESGLAHFVCYSAFEIHAEQNPVFGGLARFFRMTRGLYHLRERIPGFEFCGPAAYNAFAHSFSLVGHMLRRTAYRSQGSEIPEGLAGVDFALRHYRIGEN